MTPEQYAVLVGLVDDLVRDFSISHGVNRSDVCAGIRSYVDEDMIEDLVNREQFGGDAWELRVCPNDGDPSA